MSAKERTDVKALEKRIRELEEQLERAQMKNVALNTMIDLVNGAFPYFWEMPIFEPKLSYATRY